MKKKVAWSVIGCIVLICFLPTRRMLTRLLIQQSEKPTKGTWEVRRVSYAIENYYRTYGKLPLEEKLLDKGGSSDDRVLDDEEYDLVIQCLVGDAKVIKETKIDSLLSNECSTVVDPWGMRLRIVYDLNHDGVIAATLINGRGVLKGWEQGFVVWSLGPDKNEEIPFCDDDRGQNGDNINGFPHFSVK